MTEWIEKAKEIGFDCVGILDPQKLQVNEEVRAMCSSDKCKIYNKNWTCPPNCGTLEECQRKMHGYTHGIILQSIGHMKKTIDSRCYRETEKRHMENLRSFTEIIREVYPNALSLGAGGCRICKTCAFPEPCRFPEKALSSMEGYGLFVTQVCRDCDVPYYHGEKTITYTACVLY